MREPWDGKVEGVGISSTKCRIQVKFSKFDINIYQCSQFLIVGRSMEITQGLQDAIVKIQNELVTAIQNHQVGYTIYYFHNF